MYVKTKQTAYWVDGAGDTTRSRTARPARIQCWADRPLFTPNGTVRAIRFEGEDARVLVERGGRRQWLPIDIVMDESKAKRWLKTHFSRRR